MQRKVLLMLTGAILPTVVLAGCTPQPWEYRMEVVPLQEVYLAEYRKLTRQERSREPVDQQIQRLVQEVSGDAKLAAELQQRAAVHTTLMLNRAGARGWKLLHTEVDNDNIHWTFGRPGYGPLAEEDLMDLPSPTGLQ